MSGKTQLLREPTGSRLKPIFKSEGPKRELDSDHVGDSEPGEGKEEEDTHARGGGGDATGQGVEKGKVKKGMPPGLAAAKEAKDGKPANHEEPDGDEQEQEQEQEEKDGAKDKKPPFMAKSVTTDDLEKSIAKLNELVQEGSPVARKDVLLEKAQAGDLSKSERDELYQILGGAKAPAQTVAQQVTKSFDEPTEELQKALDVSDYLAEQHQALKKALETLGEAVEKSSGRTYELNLTMAQALASVGGLVKSLVDRVGSLEGQPARAPKSRGVVTGGRVLTKGFGGQNGAGAGEAPMEQLSKSQILDGMEALLRKSGEEGCLANGEPILTAISKYESTNMISKAMVQAVSKELNSGGAH